MNELLQVLLYFFGPLGDELPGFPCSIDDLKHMDFLASLDVFKQLFYGHLNSNDPMEMKASPLQQSDGFRVFSEEECSRMSRRCRSFLLYLEQIGLLNAIVREQMIKKLLELPQAEVTLSQVKWLAYSILSEESDPVAAAYIEKMLFIPDNSNLH